MVTTTTLPPPWRSQDTETLDPVATMHDAIEAAESAIEAHQEAAGAFARVNASSTATGHDKLAAQTEHQDTMRRRKVAIIDAGVTYQAVARLLDDEIRTDAEMRLKAIPGIDIAIFADPDTVAAWDAANASDLNDGGWPVLSTEDMAAIMDGNWEAPKPTILCRDDGLGMLYPGKVHSLAGEPGSMKTWVGLWAIAEVVAAGGTAALIDWEDRPDTAIRRLRGLGADRDALLERFRYISPTYAIKGGGAPLNVIGIAGAATLVVLDSMGEALAHSSLNQNDDGEVRNWFDSTARRLADGGAAVLILDHVVKSTETRGKWAIGSQRKLAAIDGIAYVCEAVKPLTKTEDGIATISCSKDRGGNFRHGSKVATVTFTPLFDEIAVVVAAPNDVMDDDTGKVYKTQYFARIDAVLRGGEEMGQRKLFAAIRARKDGRITDEYVREALGQMVELGYLGVRDGANGAIMYRAIAPYIASQFTDRVGASDRVGTASGRGPEDHDSSASARRLSEGADAPDADGSDDDDAEDESTTASALRDALFGAPEVDL